LRYRIRAMLFGNRIGEKTKRKEKRVTKGRASVYSPGEYLEKIEEARKGK